MNAEVDAAVAELRMAGIGTGLQAKEDDQGGAFVLIEAVAIGDRFTPTQSWIGFHIAWSYPDADVYPHFIDPEIRYVGDAAAPNQYPEGNLPNGMTRGGLMPGFDLPAVQISRRSNHRNATTDTASLKLLRIIDFLRSR